MLGRSDYMSNIAPEIILPSPEEDAAITAGIPDDPDTFELDQEWFAGAKPTSEVLPHILENRHPTRGKQKSLRNRTPTSGWILTSSNTSSKAVVDGKPG